MNQQAFEEWEGFKKEAASCGIPPGENRRHYVIMRNRGVSPRLAEMLALNKFPGVHGTSSTFMKGTHFQETQLDQVRYAEAAKQGIDTNGRRYIAGLARFPGDPEAWISSRADALRICADRGWNCHGLVEYEAPAPDQPPPADVPIAQDIVDQHVAACLRAFPEPEHTDALKEDIRDSVTQELSGVVDLDADSHVSDYSFEDAVAISESA